VSKLKLRVHGGYQVFEDKNPTADVAHAIELQKKYNGKRFQIDNIKILLDGVKSCEQKKITYFIQLFKINTEI